MKATRISKYDDYEWTELPFDVREAARILGYDQNTWDDNNEKEPMLLAKGSGGQKQDSRAAVIRRVFGKTCIPILCIGLSALFLAFVAVVFRTTTGSGQLLKPYFCPSKQECNNNNGTIASPPGATLWMTGCSGAGKTNISKTLEERLANEFRRHSVYRLNRDRLGTGLNRNLTVFSDDADRAEAVRRTGEAAALLSDAGVVTLVDEVGGLYRADRDAVRKRHEDRGIPFYEIYAEVPMEDLKKTKDSAEEGELEHFVCITEPYEEPYDSELVLKTHENSVEESTGELIRMLQRDGILLLEGGKPKHIIIPP